MSTTAETRLEDERWEDEGGRVSDAVPNAEPTLDWQGFRKRFFPDRLRHDFDGERWPPARKEGPHPESNQPSIRAAGRGRDLQFHGASIGDRHSGGRVVAPEFDDLLRSRCRLVEESGGRLLGPSAALVSLAADKQRTAEHLKAAGLRIPRGAEGT